MSSVEPPSLDSLPGSPLEDGEELYRVIGPGWWLVAEDRLSSAAFSFPHFSVDVASIVGSPQSTLSRFRPGSGLVVFSCQDVRLSG